MDLKIKCKKLPRNDAHPLGNPLIFNGMMVPPTSLRTARLPHDSKVPLTRLGWAPEKVASWKGKFSRISGKSRLVKYDHLAR